MEKSDRGDDARLDSDDLAISGNTEAIRLADYREATEHQVGEETSSATIVEKAPIFLWHGIGQHGAGDTKSPERQMEWGDLNPLRFPCGFLVRLWVRPGRVADRR